MRQTVSPRPAVIKKCLWLYNVGNFKYFFQIPNCYHTAFGAMKYFFQIPNCYHTAFGAMKTFLDGLRL